MKNVKFFLMSWLCIHVCLLFPLQSKAEEQNVPEQNINEVNVEEENKEVQEQPEQVGMKQDKEEQQEAKNEQETEKKIETDQGVITVNKPELKVGEEVLVIVEPKEKNVQSIKGILRLPKTAISMNKKECYRLSMKRKRSDGLLTTRSRLLICKVIGTFSSFKITKEMRKKSS